MKLTSKLLCLVAALCLAFSLVGGAMAADKAKDDAAAVKKEATKVEKKADAAKTATTKKVEKKADKAKKAAKVAKPVNINKATAKELAQLNGIGDKLAARIVEYRTKNGPFKSVDELAKVKGIGPKVLEKNKGLLLLK